MSVEFVLRIIGMFVCGALGWQLGLVFSKDAPYTPYVRYILVLSLAGGALGLLLTPWVTTKPYFYIRRKIKQLPAQHLFAGIIGLAIGLVIAALLTFPLSMLPEPFNKILPFVATLFLGYFGVAVMVMRQSDLFALLED